MENLNRWKKTAYIILNDYTNFSLSIYILEILNLKNHILDNLVFSFNCTISILYQKN